jgi:hypothetical protein
VRAVAGWTTIRTWIFFVIVQEGYKRGFIENLDWLSAPCPLAYTFRNTVDGYKALFEDEVFAEFAVFEPRELERAPFSAGQIVWKAEGVDDNLRIPKQPLPTLEKHPVEWLIGEALTNLYIGLCRFWRGEKLSALHFVQGRAVERILELTEMLEQEQPGYRETFGRERRFERRFPVTSQCLPSLMQGYDATPESARALLSFLTDRFDVNPKMADLIRQLCQPREAL